MDLRHKRTVESMRNMNTYHISQAKETGSKLKISGAMRGKRWNDKSHQS